METDGQEADEWKWEESGDIGKRGNESEVDKGLLMRVSKQWRV